MPWNELVSALNKSGRSLVGNVLHLKHMRLRFHNHNFPNYIEKKEHTWLKLLHTRIGELAGPFAPAATRFSMQNINTPADFIKHFPTIESLDVAGSLNCTYKRPLKDDVFGQREILLGLRTDSTLREKRVLGSNDPERIPDETLCEHNDRGYYTKAMQEARSKAQSELSNFGDQRLWLTALANVALSNFMHDLYYKDGKELTLRYRNDTIHTHHYMAYVLFDGMDFSQSGEFIRFDISELLIGTSLWITDTWLLPIPLMIKGFIKLEAERLTYDLQIKHASADDSHYRPLNFDALPKEFTWDLPSLNVPDIAKVIHDNIGKFLGDNLPKLLSLTQAVMNNTPTLHFESLKADRVNTDNRFKIFPSAKVYKPLITEDILTIPHMKGYSTSSTLDFKNENKPVLSKT